MAKVKAAEAPAGAVQYRRAKTWHIALSQMTGVMQMAFYVLLGYAAYIGNLGFAITTALVGVLITLSRVFDSVTDPIIALAIEKFNSKFGKMRFFLIVGWACMAGATTLMCNVFAGRFSFGANEALSNPKGVLVFILIYALYIIGYTFTSCTGAMTGNIMTNDPKQRPTLGVWSTIYSYLSPMIVAGVMTTVLLKKYGMPFVTEAGTTDFNWTIEVFQKSNLLVIGVSFFALVLTCIGLTPYDKPENFVGIQKNKTPSLKEMFALLKENKELGRYIVAVGSNERAARYAAVPVRLVKFAAYTILGALTGLGSFLYSSQYTSVNSAVTGQNLELDAIAAVVIGGTRMEGGRGSIVGTAVGVLLLGVIRNMMVMLGVNSYAQGLVQGLIILAAVLAQRLGGATRTSSAARAARGRTA